MPRSTVKILYLDDDRVVLETFRYLFRNEYQVFTAHTSEEAFEILKTHPDIPIVFSDYDHQQVDGLEFLIHVRHYHPNSIRIMASATCHTFPSVYHRVLYDAQIFRYLEKPVPSQIYRETVEDALDQAAHGLHP